MKNTDWLPSRRQDILTLARTWVSVFDSDTESAGGGTVKKYAAWNIPAETSNRLGALYGTAEEALAAAQEKETRTAVTTTACKTAFDALISCMRDIKKRYLYIPPLSAADIKSLGLQEPDTTHTRTGTPTAQVTVETYLTGRHQLGFRIVYLTGSPGDPANKEYRVHYSVTAPGEAPPSDPEELRDSFSTKRKKDTYDFEFGDSGKTAWFAVQIENSGRKGPWGPLVNALIP